MCRASGVSIQAIGVARRSVESGMRQRATPGEHQLDFVAVGFASHEGDYSPMRGDCQNIYGKYMYSE